MIFKNEVTQNLNIDKYQKAERSLLYYMFISPEVIKIYNKKITYMPTENYRKLAREVSLFYKEKSNPRHIPPQNVGKCEAPTLNEKWQTGAVKLKNANPQMTLVIEDQHF